METGAGSTWEEVERAVIVQPWKGQEGKGVICCLKILCKRLQRRQSQVFLRGAQGQERGNQQKSEHWKFWPHIRKNSLLWVLKYGWRGSGRLWHSHSEVPPDEEDCTSTHWEWPRLTDHQDMNVYACNIKTYIRLQVWVKHWIFIKHRSKDGSIRYTFFFAMENCIFLINAPFVNYCIGGILNTLYSAHGGNTAYM